MTDPEDDEKALSDDGSYEIVDFQEPDHRMNNFKEHVSSAGIKPKKLEEYSDMATDDDSNGDSTNGHSDGSYEFVDPEDVGERVTQREEHLDSESSDSSADYYLNMDRDFPWKGIDDGTKKARPLLQKPIEDVDYGELAYPRLEGNFPPNEMARLVNCATVKVPHSVRRRPKMSQGGIFHFQNVTYQNGVYKNVFVFPEHIELRSKMKLNDVVKDHILPFLPAKSLLRFRAVSKEWDKWIASPFLAHLQSNHFKKISGFFRASLVFCNFFSLDHFAYGVPSPSLSFMPESCFVIKSSCNGLLLCQGYNGDNAYYIVNPTNKECKILPEPKYYHLNESKCVLAFDPSPLNFPAHFKVICAISLPPYNIPVVHFEIYDSETKSWTLSNVICAELEDSNVIKDGFYFNGVAYWETCEDQLLAFDLKNEIYSLQPLPPETTCIGLLDGEMCYIKADCEPNVLEVYADYLSLKGTIEIGNGGPSGLNDFHILSPVGNDFAEIFLEEIKGGKVNGLGVDGKYFPYVNSLVSLENQ